MLIAELCLAYKWTPDVVERLTIGKAMIYAAAAGVSRFRPLPNRPAAGGPAAPRDEHAWQRAMLQLAVRRGDEVTARKIRGWLARDLVFGKEAARA